MTKVTLKIGPSNCERGIDWLAEIHGPDGVDRLDSGGWGGSGRGRPASEPTTAEGWMALARRKVPAPHVGGRRLRWVDAGVASARGDGDFRYGAKFTWSLVAEEG